MHNFISKKPIDKKQLFLISILFWSLWGIIIGLIIFYSQSSLGWDIAFISTILGNVIGWSFWGVITPLIFYLQKKIKFSKSNYFYITLIHILISLLFGITQQIYFGFFQSEIGQYFSSETLQQHFDWYLQPQRILINGSLHSIVYWLIIGSGYIFQYYQDSMKKKMQNLKLEEQLSKAKLSALQFQMQPHFLFNTLHSISALIMKNENQTAIRMVTELSDLLRYSLRSSKTHEIKLQNELELLNKYLDIIKIRFSNKISIHQNIQPNTLEALVPNFILQPLIENAVQHGIEEKADQGVIKIESLLLENILRVEISDNGKGFDSSSSNKISNNISLQNTKERLETLYKGSYSFKIDSQIDIGTTVILEIPFHTKPVTLQ